MFLLLLSVGLVGWLVSVLLGDGGVSWGRALFLEPVEEEEEAPSLAAFAARILAKRSFLDRVADLDMVWVRPPTMFSMVTTR